MNINWDIAGPAGLSFFGKITASMTHELNNALGIINENAGLMEDLMLLQEQGIEVDPVKWITIANRITVQVERADGIIRRLNVFAHSTDGYAVTVNIGSFLEQVTALSLRLLAEYAVIAEVGSATESVEITTSPFLFLHLIGRCLEFSGRNADQDKKIRLTYGRGENDTAFVLFSGLSLTGREIFPGSVDNVLLKAVGATIQAVDQQTGLLLEVTGKTVAPSV